jgi:predicted lactoylglutathione lyase
MPIQRMKNVPIVVDDLEAAKPFFAELGMAVPFVNERFSGARDPAVTAGGAA